MDTEKTSFEKLIISLNAGCATIFRVSGKIFGTIIRILAGEPSTHSKYKEVNS